MCSVRGLQHLLAKPAEDSSDYSDLTNRSDETDLLFGTGVPVRGRSWLLWRLFPRGGGCFGGGSLGSLGVVLLGWLGLRW